MSFTRAMSPQGVIAGVDLTLQQCNPFDSLPIETVQQIAESLDSDSHLCAFQASCRSARDAIDGDNFSLWRRRFIAFFEPTGWSQGDNVKYKNGYHHRRKVLKNGAAFREGKSKSERECLEVLRDLIIGAFASRSSDDTMQVDESRNITRLITFLQSGNLLTTIFKPTRQTSRYGKCIIPSMPEPLLHTIQVVCAPVLLSLDPHFIHEHFGFPDSQQGVYSTATTQPFFGGRCGLDINMELVLHSINFWRYHMVREAEQTLYSAFKDLSPSERPQWWTSQLKQGGKTLGRWWKGSYAYLDRPELRAIRSRDDSSDDLQIQDIFAGEDAAFSFQDMELHVVEDKQMRWPEGFERHLRSLTPPPPSSPTSQIRTRAQKRSGMGGTPEEIANFKPLSFRFDGSGSDVEEAFLASGWLNPLPPQNGIPGWARLTMMKYFELKDFEGAGAGVYDGNVDWDALWAYEGVVLPGGKIVLGRWWSPGSGVGEEQYSGPFILWCVDGAEGYADAQGEDDYGEEEV